MKRLSIIFALLAVVILICGCSKPDVKSDIKPDTNVDSPSNEREMYSAVQTFFSGDTVGELLDIFADAADSDTSGILVSAYSTLNSEEMYFYLPDNGSEILGYHLAVLVRTDIDGKVDESVKPAIALFCTFRYDDRVFDSVWISSDEYDQCNISFTDGFNKVLTVGKNELALYGYTMGENSYICAIVSTRDDGKVYFLPNTSPYSVKRSKLPGIDLSENDEFFSNITENFLSVAKTSLQSLI